MDDVTTHNLLSEEISSNQTKLQVITTNRERILAKKQMLLETVEKFTVLGILLKASLISIKNFFQKIFELNSYYEFR